ncbi:glycosyltransferase family 2 protein [Photobacterium sp. 2_MG-2023]|uniref:glycosyltransferase family 2 protein n=1 Tax=Photobacterium sp. 2_MG-2023 TaxID=3062663 RepID=UPI0026E1DEE1|nr:glycosyltransferase family 2 protein [Photobacterium sp. 2_MG-2023]MDO6580722.1 glycosyltransferase family 2 protein [Photobacterium sp. 2_MG-2023]
MKVALIITTYNWKEALQAVLDSVKRQSELPDEVIIADDGSRADTAELIQSYQAQFPCPLIHSWQPDDGFQLAMSRNRAMAKSQADYIIMIDGDIVMSPDFIRSHKQAAKLGYFVQGGRVLANNDISQQIMHQQVVPNLFSPGIKNRHNCISSAWLSKLCSYERNNDASTRGCNMAFWRADLIEVNGFNEDFVGWGREDSEFVHRMLNSSKKRLYLKFAGVGYHLYHDESSRASLAKNDEILENTVRQKLTRCENGIDKFLDEKS